MFRLHKPEGFSLVELMVVIAIMGALAALAIPIFLSFQMKARESEARGNLGSIKTCEEAYKAESDRYADCPSSPQAAPPGANSIPWVAVDGGAGTDFNDIGFNPNGQVRYVYEVVGSTGLAFTATATGDLDEDGAFAIFQVTAVGGATPNVERMVPDNVH